MMSIAIVPAIPRLGPFSDGCVTILEGGGEIKIVSVLDQETATRAGWKDFASLRVVKGDHAAAEIGAVRGEFFGVVDLSVKNEFNIRI